MRGGNTSTSCTILCPSTCLEEEILQSKILQEDFFLICTISIYRFTVGIFFWHRIWGWEEVSCCQYSESCIQFGSLVWVIHSSARHPAVATHLVCSSTVVYGAVKLGYWEGISQDSIGWSGSGQERHSFKFLLSHKAYWACWANHHLSS